MKNLLKAVVLTVVATIIVATIVAPNANAQSVKKTLKTAVHNRNTVYVG